MTEGMETVHWKENVKTLPFLRQSSSWVMWYCEQKWKLLQMKLEMCCENRMGRQYEPEWHMPCFHILRAYIRDVGKKS